MAGPDLFVITLFGCTRYLISIRLPRFNMVSLTVRCLHFQRTIVCNLHRQNNNNLRMLRSQSFSLRTRFILLSFKFLNRNLFCYFKELYSRLQFFPVDGGCQNIWQTKWIRNGRPWKAVGTCSRSAICKKSVCRIKHFPTVRDTSTTGV